MIRTVLLRTRCGCEKYMQVDFIHRQIAVLLRPNFNERMKEEDFPSMIIGLKRRNFLVDGCTADGIYIYTEEEV